MSRLATIRRAALPSARVAGLAGLMIGAGAMHFVTPGFFDRVVPRAFPEGARRPITYGSGVVEVVAGALLLHPRTRRLGGRATAATLLAVFPANIDTALGGGLPGVDGWFGSRQAAVLRLPLQAPPIMAALHVARYGR